MLQQMRSAAKYIWILVTLAFVGGFLLVQTSGLLGRTTVTPTTAVAVVNGQEILYQDYTRQYQEAINQQQQQGGRSLTEDEMRRIENGTFDQMVTDVLLQQEYRRRGITVSDEEIKEYAQFAPPQWIQQSPELQTNGQFDPQKYQRLLASPIARQEGLLASLEQYYRSEIPRLKLFDEISSGVYVTDAELWRIWQDQHDSAQVSYVAFRPQPDSALAKSISDDELRSYFDKHKADFERPGRAVLSVLMIPKLITQADTAAARARADSLRQAILKGAKFEDVAKSQSSDSVSGARGGDLGKGPKGRFVPEFEKAADALKPGEISQPVLTPFGFHIIRLDSRSGDTLALHHILVPITQSDSSANRTDKKADSLSSIAASSDQPAKLDSAAKKLGLTILRVTAFEDEPANYQGRTIPSVSAWAFGGVKPGETSELYDDPSGYYLARLDRLTPGGAPKFENVKEDVRAVVEQQKELDKLTPAAQQLATAAAHSTLEAAAAQQKLTVEKTPMFTRAQPVPGLGQFTEAVGAAFGLAAGAVSAPVRTQEALFVERVDRRVTSDSSEFVKAKDALRQQRIQQLRQQRVQVYLRDLRAGAKVKDNRAQINASVRRTEN